MHKMLWFVVGLMLATVAQAEPGVVLHQTHEFSAKVGADTLRTYITAKHVRIEHKAGDAILDLENGLLILMDGSARTWRQMPLAEWEAAIQQAATMNQDTLSVSPPAFERVGSAGERAGFLCDRWGLYTQRELLPGELDWVEQQIWVARELQMPPGAYEAYDRAMHAIESIGMGALVKRPKGVVLASEIRVGSEAEHEKGNVEVETLTVYRVVQKELEQSVFQVPEAYTPAKNRSDNDSGP